MVYFPCSLIVLSKTIFQGLIHLHLLGISSSISFNPTIIMAFLRCSITGTPPKQPLLTRVARTQLYQRMSTRRVYSTSQNLNETKPGGQRQWVLLHSTYVGAYSGSADFNFALQAHYCRVRRRPSSGLSMASG